MKKLALAVAILAVTAASCDDRMTVDEKAAQNTPPPGASSGNPAAEDFGTTPDPQLAPERASQPSDRQSNDPAGQTDLNNTTAPGDARDPRPHGVPSP